MEISITAILKIFIPVSFTAEGGELVEYFQAFFLTENEDGDPSVVQLNTKVDLRKHIDDVGVAKIRIQDDGKKKLLSFTPRTVNRSTAGE